MRPSAYTSLAICLVILTVTSALPTTYVILPPIKAKGSGPLYRIQENKRWGYMNQRGETVIAPRFDRAEDFFEKKAAVSIVGIGAGYIDESGAWQIEPRFSAARSFQDGAAIAGLGSMQAVLIDSSGNPLTARSFSSVQDMSGGFAAVWQDAVLSESGALRIMFGGKWGFANSKGIIAIEPRFDRVLRFTEGLAAINVNARFDESGVPVDGGKWGFIDTRGAVVIPPKFDEVKPFYSGVAVYWDAATQSTGLVDKTGGIVLQPVYAQIGGYLDDNPFHDGLALAQRRNGTREYIRPTGAVAHECRVSSCGDFSEGLAPVRDGSLMGYIDNRGAVTIPPAFDQAESFSEGLAAAKQGSLWGYIDKAGKWAIQPRFATAYRFVDGLALVKTTAHWAYVDRSGQIVRDNVWDGEN